MEYFEKFKNFFEKDELKEARDYVYNSLEKFKSYNINFQKEFKIDLELCKEGNLNTYSRDLLWFIYLDILPYDQPKSWKKILTDLRSDYNDLKDKIISKEINDFILLKEGKGGEEYNKFEEKISKEDFELLDLIKIDVERTYQDESLFQKDIIKQAITFVLFIYSKKFPLLGYKQGMNDICGIFLYILYKQYKLGTSFTKDEYTFLYFIFHSNNLFLENDLYIMYSSFMNKGIAELYLYTQCKQNQLSSTPLEKKILLTKEEIDNSEDSKIKKRIYHIFYRSMKNFDIEFYNELINRVEPEIFLFKWYLCCFTREFSINKVVHLWDLILCNDFIEYKLAQNEINDYHFRFIDSIAISMILNCKSDLMKLKNDSDSKFLDILMHYPQNIEIEQIIKEALRVDSILNPKKPINNKEFIYFEYIDTNLGNDF